MIKDVQKLIVIIEFLRYRYWIDNITSYYVKKGAYFGINTIHNG